MQLYRDARGGNAVMVLECDQEIPEESVRWLRHLEGIMKVTYLSLEEEKDEFDVELTEVGPNKVKVIKVVREITGLGLKEAKEVVDGAPKMVKEGASKAEAEDIKTKLEAEGAKVTLK